MVNFSDTTLNKKEETIKRKYKPIKFADNIRINSIFDLFHNLFVVRQETFYLNGRIQCSRNRSRSYYDAYMLCMHYYPTITFAEMYKLLQQISNKRENQLYFSTCFTVRRSVCRPRQLNLFTQYNNARVAQSLQ